MNREFLENMKIYSFMVMIFSFISIILGIAVVYEEYQENGSLTMDILLIISIVIFLVSAILYFALRRYFKKLDGESYFGFGDIVEMFMEFLIPSLEYKEMGMAVPQIDKTDRSVKSSHLWKKLCRGICINNLVVFLLLCYVEIKLIYGAIGTYRTRNPAFCLPLHEDSSVMLGVVGLILMAVVVLINAIIAFLGIRRNGILIFAYLDRSKVKFETLSQHFDQSIRCGLDIWVDEKYLFVVGNGISHVIPLEEYEECSINYTRTYFICTISGTYDCVIKYGIFPNKYKKMKRLIKEYQAKSEKDM